MNGAFKFKENLFLKYKKEITLTVGAVLTMVVMVRAVGGMDHTTVTQEADIVDTPLVAEEVAPITGYAITIDGTAMGMVESEDQGQASINQALKAVIDQLGYNPEINPEVEFVPDYSLNTTFTTAEELTSMLTTTFIDGLDEIKSKGYVMKIGDDFTVALSCEDDVAQVLKNAQSLYINSDDMVLDITLAKDDHNSLVLTPEVTMTKEDPNTATRRFTGEAVTEGEAEEGEALEETSEEEAVEEEEKDPKRDGETVSIDFAETVIVVETYVSEEEVKDVAEATEMITKENDEPKVYKVASGDVPSIIAENNDMRLSELYKLNPNLEGNERKMQIGDELIVMVPEPELSVSTQEEVVYTEAIYRGTTYVDNPNKYKGSQTIVSNGSNGTMEVTAIVTKINGDEVGRITTGQKILTEPTDKIVSRGTKPLPPKGATGNYISPLSSYRVTSPFGYRWSGFHYGIDLAAPSGNPVRASDGGTVTIASWYGNYGYLVEIDHGGGVRTRYGHNSKINVSVGQRVSQYEVVALSGNTGRSTGPHVHFEIRFDGVCANPANYIDF